MNFENVRFHEVLLKAFDRDSLKTLVRELRVRTAIGSRPAGMTAQRELIAGPDGNLWFTTENQGPPDLPGLAGIAKINPSTGAVQQFYLPSGSEANQQITFGPDANIWFADWEIGSGYFMSRMDPSTGAVKDFPLGREIGVGPITKILSDARAEYDLHSACYLADIDRVRALVADPIKKRAPDKEAMRIAATYGQEKIVKLLLDHGADPEDADFGELTVSYFAIEHASVLKLLFDAGANPKVPVTYRGNGAGPEGSTLLHEAAEKG